LKYRASIQLTPLHTDVVPLHTDVTPLHTDAHQRNMMAVMVSLHKRLEIGSDEERERQFFTHTLKHLTVLSGRQVEAEEWIITSYEVEFGREIGSGGLCVFLYSCDHNATVYCVFSKWTSIPRELERD